MKSPVICPQCDRIVVAHSGLASCSHCGENVNQQTRKKADDHGSPLGIQQQTRGFRWLWETSDELKWSLSLIAIGSLFLIWGVICPDATIKRRSWSGGSEAPVDFIGGFFLTIGIVAAAVIGLCGRKKS